MLDFVIFAITFVIFLLLLVFYLYPGSSSKKTNVPGMDPSDSVEGNISDILIAGGLHPFLSDLHATYGPIASFWMGRSLVITVGTPELFKEVQQAFNKPDELFTLYSSLVGKSSLLQLNGAEGRQRREIWKGFLEGDHLLSPAIKCIEEFSLKLSSLPKEQHVPLHCYTKALCMKICCQVAFGDYFQDEQVLKFSRIFEACWTELESQVSGSLPDKDAPRLKKFEEDVISLKSALREAIAKSSSSKSFLKALIAAGLNEDDAINDGLLFLIKFNSMASALTWMLYYTASDEAVQESIHNEVKTCLQAKPLSGEMLPKLRYVQQVVNESLRLACVEPWTARFQDLDVDIAGYIIPKKTPVILALGVALQSEKYWSQPKRFNPDTFAPSNKLKQPLSFLPFGTTDKRGCPGATLASDLMQVLLASLCNKVMLQPVQGQVATPVYGICTRPEEEVWITIKKR